MKRVIFSILLLAVLAGANWSARDEDKKAPESLRSWLLNELSATRQELNFFGTTNDAAALRAHYHQSRTHYKRIEFFVEYFSPREAKFFINGPLAPKHDPDFGRNVFYPCGFQRMEELLFGNAKDEPLDLAALTHEARELNTALEKLQEYYGSVEVTNGMLLEMCQLELFRIAAMNLSGYDGTIVQTNVTESAACVEGIEQVVRVLAENKKAGKSLHRVSIQLLKTIARTKRYLLRHPDYAAFDRLEFIREYVNPLNTQLIELHKTAGWPWQVRKQAINLQAGFLFGAESFNPRFFSMYYDDTLLLSLQASIGKKLFYDPILSGNATRSCSGCHDPGKAFSDGLKTSFALDGENHLRRNAPTLTNVAFQQAFFYDGRSYQLEQQVSDVVHNEAEMNSSLDEVALRLRGSPEYRALFSAAFAGTADTVITPYAIQKCITEYEKKLLSFNSRFDRYLHGETTAMNAREVNGYNLFAGKALCGSCHFLPLFNGTVPPFYSDSEYEVIGVPVDSSNRTLDTDSGRYCVTKIPEQLHAFKTPTLRNIALTAPYMHNGAYDELGQVVEFYHKGGGAGLGFDVPNQTLPFDSLSLSVKEKEDIVLFLRTLTDTTRFR